MATIKSRSNQISVIDGGSLDTTADLGVSFGCRNGVCGRCATTVVSGMENLSGHSEAEQAFGLDPERRLICQCSVTGGTVELDLD